MSAEVDSGSQDVTDDVLFDVTDGVARITLNRPHRRNATMRPQRVRIIEFLDEVSMRWDVRASYSSAATARSVPAPTWARHSSGDRDPTAPHSEPSVRSPVGCTIAWCTSLVNRSLPLGRDDSLALEAVVQDLDMTTVDAGEGISAYLECRPTSDVGW